MSYTVDGINVYLTKYEGGLVITEYVDTFLHTELEYNGSIITVTVKDYLGNHQPHNLPVTLVVGETEHPLNLVNGVATMPYTGGYAKVTTVFGDYRNGELEIGTEPLPVDPTEEQIAALMFEVADTQVRLFETEQVQADLIFQLIDKGVL